MGTYGIRNYRDLWNWEIRDLDEFGRFDLTGNIALMEPGILQLTEIGNIST